MLTIRSQTADLQRGWNRRDVLQLALGGAAGLFAPRVPASWAQAAAPVGKAKACILIYLYGGPSHLDIWDLKPEAPAEIRGEFKPIATRVPGIQLCEHLPKLAERAERLAILRSLTHDSPAHGSACHQMLTGHPAATQGEIAPTPDDAPHPGAVLARSVASPAVPVFASLPWKIATQINLIPGQDAGFLGRSLDPVWIQYDDQEGKRFLLPEPGKLATAMAIDKESEETRDRYGRNVFGQSLLLARRLVESGVRFVTVYWPDRRDEKALNYNGARQPVSVPMWDTHGSGTGDTANFPSLKNRLLPPLDLASSSLIDDLVATGRFDETLLVWTGEFGRTPRVQGDGRGHYSKCFSSMLAGGGIRGGIIHGASDATGSTPVRDPVSPGDLMATIYHLLGFAPDAKLTDRKGQERLLFPGQVVNGLLA